ncbi:hypothetical protein Ahy_B03g065631 [Arachis hypogaea]|uniref:Aminotransferase-like plant mobile domain-containing protein n=1 Tax=Arachis hypogaea TaxID=3818 RepID=A0A445A262_ARAHY|nr:hypothetical protein Ahy_B03g065631 [Arachis hypogaea]
MVFEVCGKGKGRRRIRKCAPEDLCKGVKCALYYQRGRYWRKGKLGKKTVHDGGGRRILGVNGEIRHDQVSTGAQRSQTRRAATAAVNHGDGSVGGRQRGEVRSRVRQELFGELPPDDCIDEFTVSFFWFQNKFRVMLTNASETTVQVYARRYIMMLLSTMLFRDKSGTRVHLRWFSYVADLNILCKYSWGSATFSWWGRYLPSSDKKGPRVIATRHILDRLSVEDVSGSESNPSSPIASTSGSLFLTSMNTGASSNTSATLIAAASSPKDGRHNNNNRTVEDEELTLESKDKKLKAELLMVVGIT